MPTSRPNQAHSKVLHEFAAELRGKFLNKGAWIETLLGDILATYFCTDPKRRRLFFSELANNMRLSSKAALLDKILQRDFPRVRQTYPRLKKRLDCLRAFRNRLAHAHIDTSRAVLAARKTEEVTFVFYEDGKTKRQSVTRGDAQRRANEANQIQRDLVEIQRVIAESA